MMVLLGVAPAFGGCGGCALKCATGSQVPPSAGIMMGQALISWLMVLLFHPSFSCCGQVLW